MPSTQKDIAEIEQVKIDKLSNLGYGIAKIDGYVVFVENACPGDILKIRIGKKNKNYGFASIIEIVEPSENRIKPFCPMQKVCGACQLQFIDYNAQLKFKKEIVEDSLFSIYSEALPVNDVIPSPLTQNYRRKIQYPVSETKESGRILAGYYKQDSHEIVNIKYCPVQPEICDKIIDFIRNKSGELKIKGYVEKKHSGDLKHILIRNSEYNNKNLVVLVINSHKLLPKIEKLAKAIYDEFDEVSGVSVNLNPKKTNLILGEETLNIVGDSYIEEHLSEKVFKISADTFFQVNPSCANLLFKYVKDYISAKFEKPTIMDAYAGITAFGIYLSDIAKKVISVESVKASVVLADKLIKDNKINNIELHNMDAGLFFEKELSTKNRRFDITIIDPPRKGCTVESLEYVFKLTKNKIIYVSCNPSTLARDLRYLTEKGCKVESVQPFDMFPHTYHIENVAIIDLPQN